MLPLKPGACIFVYECHKQLNKDVPIIPVGINYFGAHRFRSKVTMKIGKAIHYDFDDEKITDGSYKR